MNGAALTQGPAAATAAPRSAIVAAMPQELTPLLRRVRVAQRSRLGDCRVWWGTLGPSEVVLACTGEGAPAAESGLRAVIERFDVNRVIVIGIAGGLSPELREGALVVASELLDHRQRSRFPDPGLIERALRCPDAVSGVNLTTRQILCTTQSKAEARRSIPGDRASTVDLESAAFAAVADDAELPYLVVRAVCDTADEELPIDLNQCCDEQGRIRRAAVIGRALLHPSSVPRLWGLRRRVLRCSERLAQCVESLLHAEVAR